MRIADLVQLTRPFTLLAPPLGMVAGGVAALGWDGRFAMEAWSVEKIAIGALGAALLNVASNAVNQIFDVEVDRINKPKRPLPSGAVSMPVAWAVTIGAYVGASLAAWAVNELLLLIVLFTVAVTYFYSAPPLRTKRHWLFANLTIALPRGFLLPLAGWAAIWGTQRFAHSSAPLPIDAWLVAAASGLFVLGAASTKDYADLDGDRAGGCITLPLRFGIEPSVRMIVPFLVLPWLLLPAGVWLGWLRGHPLVLVLGGIGLALIGARAAWLLLRDPAELTSGRTHPAWVLMYLMMIASQAVVAVAYVLTPGTV